MTGSVLFLLASLCPLLGGGPVFAASSDNATDGDDEAIESFIQQALIPFDLAQAAQLSEIKANVETGNAQRQDAYNKRDKACSIASLRNFHLSTERPVAHPLSQYLAACVQAQVLLGEKTLGQKVKRQKIFSDLETSIKGQAALGTLRTLKQSVQAAYQELSTFIQTTLLPHLPVERYDIYKDNVDTFENLLSPILTSQAFIQKLQEQADGTLQNTRSPLTDDLRTQQVVYQELFKASSPYITAIVTAAKARLEVHKKKVLGISLPYIKNNILSSKIALIRCQLESFNTAVRKAIDEATIVMQTNFGALLFFTQQMANLQEIILASGSTVVLARTLAQEIQSKCLDFQKGLVSEIKDATKKKKDFLKAFDAFWHVNQEEWKAADYETLLATYKDTPDAKLKQTGLDYQNDFQGDTDELLITLLRLRLEIPEIDSTAEVQELKNALTVFYGLVAFTQASAYDPEAVLKSRIPPLAGQKAQSTQPEQTALTVVTDSNETVTPMPEKLEQASEQVVDKQDAIPTE